jgi:hypothetical protein
MARARCRSLGSFVAAGKAAPAARHLARRSSPVLDEASLSFEQRTGQGVVIGVEQAELFD